MKSIRKISISILILSFLILGCSEKTTVKINMEALGNELIEKVGFEDELNKVNDINTINMLYDIKDAKNTILYISSGATAEEIGIFEFENEDLAKEGLQKAKQRIENQKVNFDGYMPLEIKKLDDAIVKRIDNYVVLCVVDDNEAEKIINKYVN
ncbi:DUF4358 domain-containing protein [Anaerorhabdus sp.]|uniref:DUF4358 domain-containing protein n=1 Tax=Anaerorhabdus sp. TaxID=1872524 RepID=UPI002FC5E348